MAMQGVIIMLIDSEYRRIVADFSIKQQERRRTLVKRWGIITFVISVIIFAIIYLLPDMFEDESTAWILPVYGSMLFFPSLIGFIMSFKYNSEKPFFEYLYPELYQCINREEGWFLNYHPYDKEEKEYNLKGGLFTRFATVQNFRHIDGKTSDEEVFHIFDCKMTTSNGKSQTTHFDGVYIVINKQNSSYLQIRSQGSPKLKGIKFDKKDTFDRFSIYKESNEMISFEDKKIVSMMSSLDQSGLYKHLYLSTVKDQIHLALWYKKHPARKQKVVTRDVINQVIKYFYSEIDLVEQMTLAE